MFMENRKSVAQVVKKDGILSSLLAPLDCSIEMTATKDIEITAAKILRSTKKNQLIVSEMRLGAFPIRFHADENALEVVKF